MLEFIQGNKFISLARFVYAPPYGKGNIVKNIFPQSDYRHIVNTLDKRFLNDGDIIFTTTFFADYLFTEDIQERYILITHNCDTNVDFAPPYNVIRWYTTNVNIKNEKIYSIPIGIENDFWLKDKHAIMERKLKHPKKFCRMLYMNHNTATNPKRQIPYNILGGKSWVTTEHGSNGQGFDNYINNVYNHPFVVCPEGNGIDTHRIWECLYMNTIPIQIRNINNQFYTDLPILFIDNWEELSERMLYDTYMQFVGKKWNLEKLDFKYWKNEIKYNNPLL